MISTAVNRIRHICKGAKYTDDMVTVGMRHALQLINDGRAEFIETSMRGDIENSETIASSDHTRELMSSFNDTKDGCIPAILNQQWAKRAACGSIY